MTAILSFEGSSEGGSVAYKGKPMRRSITLFFFSAAPLDPWVFLEDSFDLEALDFLDDFDALLADMGSSSVLFVFHGQ